ncbi:hypothetical protein FRC03_012300, partial [Tulasnella sp. 419]
PSLPQRPRIFTKAWIKKKSEAPSFLPPFLVKKFPLNVPIYLSIPFLYPPLVAAVVIAFSINVVRSRRRIKLLESSGKGSRNTMVELFRTVERDMEDVVVEMMDAEGPVTDDPYPPPPSPTSLLKPQLGNENQDQKLYPVSLPPWSDQFDKPEDQPSLSDAQKRMISNLNTIPHLKKHFVFIDNVRNSHATIVCRDIKAFSFHRRGEGVLRHYADHFEL